MSDNVTVLTVDDNNLELTMADNAPLLSATADINNPEPTMDNKSPPTFCRMCDAAFPSTAEWRQHMKSDQHVNMLRKQLATSENSTLPVSYADLREREASQPEDELQDTESDTESNPNPEEQLAPDFIPENCLFCGKANDTFEDSLAHMTSTHSFTVPYQDRLAVDLETVVAYLHLVIYGYHECICCATRRSTVEGVQQHMMAKGHCRYDMSLDLEEFYDTPESEYHAASSLVQSDQTSLRLPSGKTASHRAQPVTTAPRPSRQTATASSSRSHSHLIRALESSSEVTARNAEDGSIPASQISRLSTGDQRSLRHLSEVELRSVLTATTRRIDSSVRLEARAKRKLERKRNKIMVLTKYYKTENPVYQCG